MVDNNKYMTLVTTIDLGIAAAGMLQPANKVDVARRVHAAILAASAGRDSFADRQSPASGPAVNKVSRRSRCLEILHTGCQYVSPQSQFTC